MGLVLDTSILVAHERRRFDLDAFAKQFDEPLAICAITASELLHRVWCAEGARVSEKRARYAEAALSTFELLPFGIEQARTHAQISVELQRVGEVVARHEVMIAATALNLGFRLATLDVDGFRRVPGLQLVEDSLLRPFIRA